PPPPADPVLPGRRLPGARRPLPLRAVVFALRLRGDRAPRLPARHLARRPPPGALPSRWRRGLRPCARPRRGPRARGARRVTGSGAAAGVSRETASRRVTSVFHVKRPSARARAIGVAVIGLLALLSAGCVGIASAEGWAP